MDGEQPVAQRQPHQASGMPPPPGMMPMMMGHHGISGMPMRPLFGRGWARPPPPPPPPRSKDGGREVSRRGREKVDILDMTYEEYLESFEKIRGGDEQKDEQQSQGAGNVQMMTEEQYIEYCKKYTEQMGMPFDEGMVRNHYQQMKSQFSQ